MCHFKKSNQEPYLWMHYKLICNKKHCRYSQLQTVLSLNYNVGLISISK